MTTPTPPNVPPDPPTSEPAPADALSSPKPFPGTLFAHTKRDRLVVDGDPLVLDEFLSTLHDFYQAINIRFCTEIPFWLAGINEMQARGCLSNRSFKMVR